MAKDRGTPQAAPLWNAHLVEWSLLAGVLLVLTLLFVRQVRVVQGQSELAAVRTTLGALRMALVIDHAHTKMAPGVSKLAMAQQNPFELLQRRPVNFAGDMTQAQAESAPAGSWVFDPVCVCVGYLPMYAQWFDSPSGNFMAWYQISGAPGPLQLTAREVYKWQNEIMN